MNIPILKGRNRRIERNGTKARRKLKRENIKSCIFHIQHSRNLCGDVCSKGLNSPVCSYDIAGSGLWPLFLGSSTLCLWLFSANDQHFWNHHLFRFLNCTFGFTLTDSEMPLSRAPGGDRTCNIFFSGHPGGPLKSWRKPLWPQYSCPLCAWKTGTTLVKPRSATSLSSTWGPFIVWLQCSLIACMSELRNPLS